MSDSLASQPVNGVIYGGRENTGINRTGALFGNPISSYDINSTQNSLINLLAGYITKSGESTASIDLEGWGASTVADRNAKIHNIRAAIADPDTGETYFLYCPSLSINLPSGTGANSDQYLRIYYRIMAYTAGDPSSSHYMGTPKADSIPRYGYVKSSCTATETEYAQNDIGGNQIDSEVSIRKGIQWTLAWDNKENDYTGEYKKGPIVALYRYKSSSAKFLFNTTRRLAYNADILGIPTVYARTVGGYIILDGVYDMLMSRDDSSVFKATVVFDQSFSLSQASGKHIVVGVKDAPDIALEYRLADGSVVSSGSRWWGISWQADKPYLMHCAGGVMSYTDPSTEQWRTVERYTVGTRVITNGHTGTYISKNSSHLSDRVLYVYSGGSWSPKDSVVYNFGGFNEGIGHVHLNGKWQTAIPAGTLVSVPVYYRDGASGLYDRVYPQGTVLCNGASLDRATYSELFRVLGTRFGSDSASTFKVPNFSGLYPKSIGGNITSPYTSTSQSSVTLTSANIPSMAVRNTSGSDSSKLGFTTDTKSISPTFTTKVWLKSLPTISLSSGSLDSLMKEMLKHYHLPGHLAYTAGQTYLDSNAFMYNRTNTVSDSTTGAHKLKFPNAISPGNTSSAVTDSDKRVNYDGINRQGYLTTGTSGAGSSVVAAATEKTSPNVSWSLTSLGIQSRAVSSGINAGWSISAGEGNSTYFGASTSAPSGAFTHNHTGTLSLGTLRVGNTNSSGNPTPIPVEPSYYKVNTYIYLGESLIVPETSQQIRAESQGAAYAAPTVSSEMQAIGSGLG